MSIVILYVFGICCTLILLNPKDINTIQGFYALFKAVLWPVTLAMYAIERFNLHAVAIIANITFSLLVAIFASYFMYVSIFVIMPRDAVFATIGIGLSVNVLVLFIGYAIMIIKLNK